MAYMVMDCIVMVCMIIGYMGMDCIVMVRIEMAHIVVDCVSMAYILMAYRRSEPTLSLVMTSVFIALYRYGPV